MKSGILYCLSNVKAWCNYKKCGRTSQNINKRVSNLQTSLLDNCNIIYTTDILIDCYFYEYLLKLILKNNRLRNDREFFDVEIDEIIEIYNVFNYVNKILNSEEKLNNYIKNNYPQFFTKKRNKLIEVSSSDESKKTFSSKRRKYKKLKLFVDTSNL
jgi:hypothetical protein